LKSRALAPRPPMRARAREVRMKAVRQEWDFGACALVVLPICFRLQQASGV